MSGRTAADEIEDIKRLKARYCRLMDQKRWQEWGDLFTADAVLETGEGDGHMVIAGRDAIRDGVAAAMDGILSSHNAGNPEIELTGPKTATGIWSATFIQFAGRLRGYGFYYEDYVKDEGAWRIAKLSMPTTFVEGSEIPELYEPVAHRW
jgi:hypothetical protein